MSRLKVWIAANSRWLKWVFYGLMAVAVVLVARNEFSTISGEKMRQILESHSPAVLMAMALGGILAFTATGLYDVCARRQFDVSINIRQALRIGWIAQAFNNFAGLGGLTGGTIRTNYYTKSGTEKTTALKVTLAIWAANLVGLFLMLITTLPFAVKYDRGLWIVPLIMSLYIPLYFFGHRIKIGRFNLRKTPFGIQGFKDKVWMAGASVADWLLASIYFWFAVRLFEPHASLHLTIFAYATATLVGLLSFVPAGLGTFDVTILALYKAMGYNSTELFLALLLYRVGYYVIPWILATIATFGDLIAPKIGLASEKRRQDVAVTVLWVGILFAGLMLIFSVVTPEVFTRLKVLHQLIPKDILKASALTTLLIGIMLVILSRGIRARVQRVYHFSLVLLIVAAMTSLLKGLDYEEAGFMLFFALLLYLSRDAFDRDPLTLTWKNVVITLGIAFLIPFGIFEWRLHHHGHLPALVKHAPMGQTIGFYTLLVAILCVILMYSRSRKLEFVPPSVEDFNKLHALMDRWGGNEYTHLFNLGDKMVFFNQAGTVALMYRPHGDNLLILGDPIGNPKHMDAALDEFVKMGEEHSMNVSIYEIAAPYLHICADLGFEFIKIGEDASVHLPTWSNVGNKGKVFRRMRNRMGEKGTHFELLTPPYDAETFAALKEVSDAWLQGREEIGFSLGFFDEAYLSRAPIAVVRSDERIEGFANLMIVNDEVASVDLMRIRPDAPGGTMDGIFVSLIEWSKNEGYTYFNLGMAPMSNVGNRVYSHGKDRVIRLVYDFGNRVYNMKGLRSYKDKFNPEWTSRYLAYRNMRVLPKMLISLLEVIHRPMTDNTHLCTELGRTEGPNGLPKKHHEKRNADDKRGSSKGAEPKGAEPKGAEPKGAEPKGAEPKGAEPKLETVDGAAPVEGASTTDAEAEAASLEA